MPQSLVKMYAHLIFSTKNREPWLTKDLCPDVHQYLAEILRNLGCAYVVAGGIEDHVHILFRINKLKTLVETIEELKRESSKYIKTLSPRTRSFFWQKGYGIFSVSPIHLSIAEDYVLNQEQHHERKTFQDEFRRFLKDYDVDYDGRYVWD